MNIYFCHFVDKKIIWLLALSTELCNSNSQSKLCFKIRPVLDSVRKPVILVLSGSKKFTCLLNRPLIYHLSLLQIVANTCKKWGGGIIANNECL